MQIYYEILTPKILIKILFSNWIVIKKLMPMWRHWNSNKFNEVCGHAFNSKVFKIFKLPTDLISIENFLSAEIWHVTDFRGLKLDWWPESAIEIASLNEPYLENQK